jgi:hypothetical protein
VFFPRIRINNTGKGGGDGGMTPVTTISDSSHRIVLPIHSLTVSSAGLEVGGTQWFHQRPSNGYTKPEVKADSGHFRLFIPLTKTGELLSQLQRRK